MSWTASAGPAAMALYLVGTGLLFQRLRRQAAGVHASKTAPLVVGLLAVALHAVNLSARVLTPEGLNLGFFNALSVVSWLAALIVLAAAWREPVENLGLGVLPFAALALGLELAFNSRHLILAGAPWPLEAHVAISIVAYSLLSIAAVHALVLAWEDHALHAHHAGGLVRGLPPLATMERLLFQLIGAGFVLLTLALATGFLFVEDLFAQHLVHKTVLSIAAWALFGLLLAGRWRFGWRGRVAIRWTLGGFVCLALAYFGTKLVLELILA